ncbi:unnamed protein product, partial [Rotaria sp. Silwood2]
MKLTRKKEKITSLSKPKTTSSIQDKQPSISTIILKQKMNEF